MCGNGAVNRDSTGGCFQRQLYRLGTHSHSACKVEKYRLLLSATDSV